MIVITKINIIFIYIHILYSIPCTLYTVKYNNVQCIPPYTPYIVRRTIYVASHTPLLLRNKVLHIILNIIYIYIYIYIYLYI